MIERAGHKVVHTLTPADDLLAEMPPETELVAVAGGDGTVQRAATALAERGIPLAVLPFGTANNIASSLALDGPTEELIAGWEGARRVGLDLGVTTGPWDPRRFIESTGAGLVAKGIVIMDGEAPHDESHPDDMIAKALQRFRDVLAELTPRRCRIVLDGEAHEEELLLLEVHNIRSVGPSLALAPEADPSDGSFDVITAGEAEREALERYLVARQDGREGRLELPRRRARQVEIHGFDLFHIDDWVHPDTDGEPVKVAMLKGAVEILVPSRHA